MDLLLPILLVAVAAMVVVGFVAGNVVRSRRREGVELEPAPAEPRPAAEPAGRVPDRDADIDLLEEVDGGEVAEGDLDHGGHDDDAPAAAREALVEPSFRDRLARARSTLSGYLAGVLARSDIDEDTWDELEEALLLADVGVGPTTELLDACRERVRTEGITDPDELLNALKSELKSMIGHGDRSLRFDADALDVWLFVGVNGVGKTTTIGKVGARQREDGRSVLMAAGDTFRAAAAEQLQTWAERSGSEFVRGDEGADPSSVIFDGVQRAAAQGIDLVLGDTAGRLHTKSNLMEELTKVRRVADRDPGNVSEVLLVLDATTGQNGLVQARQFTEAVEVTGVVLTKLDGSAKGGIVVAIQAELGIPVKLVGLGETIGDLVEFDPDEFVDALFATS